MPEIKEIEKKLRETIDITVDGLKKGVVASKKVVSKGSEVAKDVGEKVQHATKSGIENAKHLKDQTHGLTDKTMEQVAKLKNVAGDQLDKIKKLEKKTEDIIHKEVDHLKLLPDQAKQLKDNLKFHTIHLLQKAIDKLDSK